MSKNLKIIIVIALLCMVTISSTIYITTKNWPYFKEDKSQTLSEDEKQTANKSGTLTQNETWNGEILVTDYTTVPEGITLTIEPGTIIKFKHYRGYKEPWKGTGLSVVGGTIKAIGTPTKQIWFTSDAEEPINGDWGGLELYHTNNSEFRYVIVEYTGIGIAQFDSNVTISHSIIRWVNAEGLYAERSQPIIEYNLLYENGYHEIALEQFNQNVQIRYNIFAGDHVPIIVIDSMVNIEGNYFKNYTNIDWPAIQVAGMSVATIKGNKFENNAADPPIVIRDSSSSATIMDNDYGDGSVPIPILDFNDVKNNDLGYTPGDAEDKFMYVFDSEDETRKVIKRIGQGVGFGWALEYANGYLWKLDSDVIFKIDPVTGNYESLPINNSQIMWARGLAYDGEYFWANDNTLHKIFKFRVVNNSVEILDSFNIPDPENGGRQGLATDGTYLYLPNRAGNKVFEINKTTGVVVREIELMGIDLAGPFTCTGSYFWSNCGSVWQKWTKEGELVGKIYSVAGGPRGCTWDGKYLWSLTSTCELWNDAKIFQIEILDDSLE